MGHLHALAPSKDPQSTAHHDTAKGQQKKRAIPWIDLTHSKPPPGPLVYQAIVALVALSQLETQDRRDQVALHCIALLSGSLTDHTLCYCV